MTDPALVVERNMRDDEKAKLLEHVLGANPRLDGAHVADLISMAYDTDSMEHVTEELWQRTEGEYDRPPASVEELALYGHAMTALALVYGEKAIDYEPVAVRGILHRYTKEEG